MHNRKDLLLHAVSLVSVCQFQVRHRFSTL